MAGFSDEESATGRGGGSICISDGVSDGMSEV